MIKIMEHANGEWRGSGDKRYFWYYDQYARKGDQLTLKFKNGTTKKYIYNGEEFINTKDKSTLEYSVHFYDNQKKKHWGVGKNKYTIACLDKTCKGTVSITENPYSSIRLIPSAKYTLKYKKDGGIVDPRNELGINKDKFFKYRFPTLHKGDRLVLKRKDGKTETYKPETENNDGIVEYKFVRKDGREISLDELTREFVYGGQIEKHWKIGKNIYKMSYLGMEFSIPVYVKK